MQRGRTSVSQLATAARAANVSPGVNVWRVLLGGQPLLVTPAHVAVHSTKDGKWRRSKLLDDAGLGSRDWYVPARYPKFPKDLTCDLAWSPVAKSEESDHPASSFLETAESMPDGPEAAQLFFRQPYKPDGQWEKNATLGSLATTLYPVSGKEQLLEALDVGFRGLSGAVAVAPENEGKCLGFFVRRGDPVMAGPPGNTFAQLDGTKKKGGSASLSSISTPDIKVLGEIMEKRFDTIESQMLTKDDLFPIFNAVSLRRGIILPCAQMMMLTQVEAADMVNISTLIGTPTPSGAVDVTAKKFRIESLER